MRVTFDIASRLPEGLGVPVESAEMRAILGDENRVVHERVADSDGDLPGLLHMLAKTMLNPLVTGIQITIEEIEH